MSFILKPPLSFEDQLLLLKNRGMSISEDDHQMALRALETLNYYRLSGYWFQFKQKGSEIFLLDTKFRDIWDLYQYDQALRLLLNHYLSIIELNVRAQLAYHFSHEYGSYGHYDPINFKSRGAYDEFMHALASAIDKNKKLDFVRNHIDKYGGDMPLWVGVEILSFSTLSKFYEAINHSVQQKIAKSMGCHPMYLERWLHSLSVLRNICAHYGRIYNRKIYPALSFEPQVYKQFTPKLETTKLFAYILCMVQLLPESQQRIDFLQTIVQINQGCTLVVELSRIGFPSDWEVLFASWMR